MRQVCESLKCIAGILTPDEGHIELDGVTLYDSASRINLPPQRRQVGYLFQQYALFPNMTVRQNIAAAVRDKARRQTEVAEKLRQFRLEAVRTRSRGSSPRAAAAVRPGPNPSVGAHGPSCWTSPSPPWTAT